MDEWKIINDTLRIRNNTGLSGLEHSKFGMDHMFPEGVEETCDYHEILALGADENVYGKYKEIENLGINEVLQSDTFNYRNSSCVQKKVECEEKKIN